MGLDGVLHHNYCPDCGAAVETDRRTDNEPFHKDAVSHMVTTRAKAECTECSFSKWVSRSWFVPADSPRAVEDVTYSNLNDWLP